MMVISKGTSVPRIFCFYNVCRGLSYTFGTSKVWDERALDTNCSREAKHDSSTVDGKGTTVP